MLKGLIRTTSFACLLVIAACSPHTTADSSPTTPATAATTPMSGEQAYLANCSGCHDQAVYKAPSRLFLGMLGPENILHAMNEGVMQEQAAALPEPTRREIAEYLSGKKFADLAETRLPPSCQQAGIPGFDASKKPASQGWGVDRRNTRFHTAETAGLTVSDLGQLEVRWAFAYPNAIQARSQPTIAGGALFVGSQDGTVWSLDARTGCLHWKFRATAEVRTAIVVSPWVAGEAADITLYFGDILARVYAVDARTGELRWMKKVDDHPNATITGTPTLAGSRLYVPVSSLEVALPGDPDYACCTFRGSVVALDAKTGEQQWKTWTIDEPPSQVGVTRAGTPILAPSGAPVWNSPTVDLQRQRLYFGTGENYSSPADGNSDAIMALDLRDGRKLWVSQQTSGDAWNVGCLSQYTTNDANCPEEDGPDFDFASSTMLLQLENGDDILVAGQKSGAVMGLDPDTGKTLWKTQVGRGGVQGGVHFGMAASGEKLFVPISDMFYPEDITKYKFQTPARPGMFAVDARNGNILWSNITEDVCAGLEYCNPGISQAVTAIPGAVIAGHMDGRLRIYSAKDGAELWQLNTLREFDTVSGETARGGSFGGGGPLVHDGMIYVNSGYGLYFHMPGNVLLALGPKND